MFFILLNSIPLFLTVFNLINMNDIIISGIQQVGVGVKDVYDAWRWYKKYFGFDVRVFEEAAPANYMLPYTGGEPQERHAGIR